MVGLGRKRPNGKKIFELRRKIGLKQEVLADEAGVSVRTLRDIERKDHAIHSVTITAIATQLKISPDQITLSTPEDSQQHHMLKLKPFRSAHQLSCLAEEAHQFDWGFNFKGKTAKETQQLVGIVRSLEGKLYSCAEPPSYYEFQWLHQLAQLQESLDVLSEGGVRVLAASYYQNSLASQKNKSPGMKVLVIRFVSGEVDELDVSIDPRPPLERQRSRASKNRGTDRGSES